MHLLEDTDEDFFPTNHAHAPVKKLPSRLDIIYCTSENDTSNHGIPFEVPSMTKSHS